MRRSPAHCFSLSALVAHEKWLLFLFCLLAHTWNIGADLPFVYNADEPHHLNVAAAYSTGDLNPHDFKYPALWSYVVAGLLGLGFLVAKVLGLVLSAEEYAVQFLTNPTVYYLGVRLCSALLVSCSLLLLYDAGARFRDRLHGRLMGLFFLFTPLFLSYGRDGTPYGLLIFMLALSVHQLLGLATLGTRRYYATAGAALGLAVGTHYLAAPLLLVIPFLHAARTGTKPRWTWAVVGLILAGTTYLLTNPYSLLDWRSFLQTLHSLDSKLNISSGTQFRQQLVNTLQFLDAWGLGAAVICGGLLLLPKPGKKEAAVWLLPWLVTMPYLAHARFGLLPRFSMPVLMPLIVLAAMGLHALLTRLGKNRFLQSLVVLTLFLPSFAQFLEHGFPRSQPDTRSIAKEWIETHLPSGSKILVFDPFGVPPLNMAPAQLERLYRRCVEMNHPRANYYRLKLKAIRCPSYEIFSIRRTNYETMDLPERVERSYQAQDAVDPDSLGLAGLRALGIEYLILDPALQQSRSESPWYAALIKDSAPLYEISPETNRVKGPALKIYSLIRPTSSSR